MNTVSVSNTTLFHVAAKHLGDATRWEELAELNGTSDPLIIGIKHLKLPIMITKPRPPHASS